MSPNHRPRKLITGNVLLDAGLVMCAVGLALGLLWPFFAVMLGADPETVFRTRFVLPSVAGGLAVGVIGTIVIRREVGGPLRRLSASMTEVREQLERTHATGDLSEYHPERFHVALESDDALGRCATSFNSLIEVLAETRMLDERIRALSVDLAEHLEIQPLAEIALAHVVEEGPFDAGAVLLVHHDEIEVVASSGLTSPDALVTHPMVRDAIDHGRGRRLSWPDGVTVDAALVSFRPRAMDLRLLSAHGVAFGVFLLASARDVAADSERLAAVATAALSLSLRNAITHAEVEQLAAIDSLTGLYNRRLGLQRLDEEYGRAQRARSPLAVVMFDIDHFKVVNDTYGHPVGDRVLRAVAEATAGLVRDGDTLVRLGGEEFMVIAPGASLADGRELAERMRHACSEVGIVHGATTISVTISLGVAALPDPKVDQASDLIDRADEAMYAAKRSGRNRVVSVTPGAALTLVAG